MSKSQKLFRKPSKQQTTKITQSLSAALSAAKEWHNAKGTVEARRVGRPGDAASAAMVANGLTPWVPGADRPTFIDQYCVDRGPGSSKAMVEAIAKEVRARVAAGDLPRYCPSCMSTPVLPESADTYRRLAADRAPQRTAIFGHLCWHLDEATGQRYLEIHLGHRRPMVSLSGELDLCIEQRVWRFHVPSESCSSMLSLTPFSAAAQLLDERQRRPRSPWVPAHRPDPD
ncbi:hypothetical protein [Cupriavidus necator]